MSAVIKRSDALTEAISAILIQDVFWSSLLLDLTVIVETDTTAGGNKIDIAATDGHYIWINPVEFQKLTIKERIGVFVHEIVHIILGHNPRMAMYMSLGVGPDMKPFSVKRWNHACDYVGNAIITAAKDKKGQPKYHLPLGALLNGQITANDIVDEVYSKIPEPDEDDDGGWDGHEPPTDPENAPNKGRMQAAVAKAAELSKVAGQGTTPGVQRLIDSILEPQVNWQEHLRKSLTLMTKGRDTHTWSKPHKRKLATPPHLYMPGRAGLKGPVIAVEIDCSGSISDRQVEVFMTELAGIMSDIEPSMVYVFMVDDAVLGEVYEIDDVNDLTKVKPVQGGGTDMRVVFDEIEKREIPVEVVVIFSDLYTPFPESETITTLWCSTTDQIAPHGITVRVRV